VLICPRYLLLAVSNAETTLLYILSTLAQTCAALAAFVGAVGLYRLQSLRNQRRDVYRDIANTIGRQLPSDRLIAEARAINDEALHALVERYDALPGTIRASVTWLMRPRPESSVRAVRRRVYNRVRS